MFRSPRAPADRAHTSGNTIPAGAEPTSATSGNTARLGRPRRTLDLPGDLADELTASTDLGKDRTVPLHTQARASISAAPPRGPLVRNRGGGALPTRAANTIVSALGAAAGIGPADDGEPFGPHVLRRTFGTDLVRGRGEAAAAPVDVVLVAELMGHTHLNTTRRYALPTDADKTRALAGLTTDR
ncbi:integrase [Spinactinospora alkalitolerans]|uniref:Integrase n=1 Tax=Spinactinospora alkalitolerans TaxID=687207 RepID=A0A852TX01_9ACTN|nr:tyrosine-type recombinase/integrase [Spinactinospora alkalitolerans]NYE47363.1 integrase [Spinactinospora alkalitolerans]